MCDKKKKSKVYDKKKEKMFKDIRRQKIYQISLIVSTVKVSIVFNYLILFNLKEQETIQVTVDNGVAVQMSSLPEEGISEQYMAINSFSQLLTVIFQSTKPFLWTIHGYDVEWLFFYFAGINDRWCYWRILVVQIIHGIYGSPTAMSSCSYSFWFRSLSVMFSSLLAEQLLWRCCFRLDDKNI